MEQNRTSDEIFENVFWLRRYKDHYVTNDLDTIEVPFILQVKMERKKTKNY